MEEERGEEAEEEEEEVAEEVRSHFGSSHFGSSSTFIGVAQCYSLSLQSRRRPRLTEDVFWQDIRSNQCPAFPASQKKPWPRGGTAVVLRN